MNKWPELGWHGVNENKLYTRADEKNKPDDWVN